MFERLKSLLPATVISYSLFLVFTPAHAVPDNSCGWNPPKSLYNYKFSMTPEKYSDNFINAYILPQLTGDIQSVWRRSLVDDSGAEEIIQEHISSFYEDIDENDKVKLYDKLLMSYDILEMLKLRVAQSESADLDVDIISESIRLKKSWNTGGKKSTEFASDFIRRVEQLDQNGGAKGNIGVARAYFETTNDWNLRRGVSPNSITTSGSCFENEIYITEYALRMRQYRALHPLNKSRLAEFVKYEVDDARKRGVDSARIELFKKGAEEENKTRTLTDYLIFKLGIRQTYSIMLFKWQGELYTKGFR